MPETQGEAPEIRELDPNTIVVRQRLRPLNPEQVAALAASIAELGVLQPVTVDLEGDTLVLVDGEHRRAAVLALRADPKKYGVAPGMTIPAVVRNAGDVLAELREIEANLIRHELNALDRAVFLSRRKTLYDGLYPLAGKRGRKLAQVAPISFSRSAEAKKIGLSRASIDRAVARLRDIAEDVRPLLAGTDAAMKGSVLKRLGTHTHDEQRRIVADAVADALGRARARAVRAGKDPDAARAAPAEVGIAAAIRRWKLVHAAPADAAGEEDAAFERALATWNKWPATVRTRLLARVGATVSQRKKEKAA